MSTDVGHIQRFLRGWSCEQHLEYPLLIETLGNEVKHYEKCKNQTISPLQRGNDLFPLTKGK